MKNLNTNKGKSQAQAPAQPSKISAKFHETKGDLKESLGRAFGNPGWQQSGAQERAQGHAEYQAATGQGSYGHGTKERLGGKKDQLIGSLTGDRAQQTQGKQRHVQGTAQQKWNGTT